MMIDLTPHAQAQHWCAPYIGRPWSPIFNCWHLVREVQLAQFGHDFPAYDLDAEDAKARLPEIVAEVGWARADGTGMREGDLLLMRGPDGLHIGLPVLIGGAWWLLHNLGGVDGEGRVLGSVRLDRAEHLGRLRYGRFELWRAKA